MDILIRPLEEKDYAAWRELFVGYIDFYQAQVADETIELTWQRLLSNEPGSHDGLVAVDAPGAVVGIAHILIHRSTWSNTWYCYLEDLFVRPDMRTGGIGRQLIGAVYAEADRRGCTRTYWSTQETNARARRLYDQVAVKSEFVQYRR